MNDLTLSHLTVTAPPMELISVAQAHGFTSVGLRICGRKIHDDYPVQVLGNVDYQRQIRASSQQHGIRVSSVNAFQIAPEINEPDLGMLADAAMEIGAPAIIINCFDFERQRVIDRLSYLSEQVSSEKVKLALEFLPYSTVKNLESALSFLRDCGKENIGLLIDVLHLYRSGGSYAQLTQLSPDEVVFAQLCDAQLDRHFTSEIDLLNEARTERLELGAGTLPLYEFIHALPSNTELEYEVVRGDLLSASATERAKAARLDVNRFLTQYAQHQCGV